VWLINYLVKAVMKIELQSNETKVDTWSILYMMQSLMSRLGLLPEMMFINKIAL